MKTKLRLLRIIATRIDLDLFYSINISGSGITFQGYATSQVINKLYFLDLDFKYHAGGKWLCAKKGCLDFTLTFK